MEKKIPFLPVKPNSNSYIPFVVQEIDFYKRYMAKEEFTRTGVFPYQSSTTKVSDKQNLCFISRFDPLFNTIFDSYISGDFVDFAEKFVKTSKTWKLFIDVDARGFDNWDEDAAIQILEDVKKQICVFWNQKLPLEKKFTVDDLSVMEANRLYGDPLKRKLSYHIVLTHGKFSYSSIDQMREDIIAFKTYLSKIDKDQKRFFYFDPWAKKKLSIVDSNIYYDFFCLRFLWCAKKEDFRPLNLIQFGKITEFDFEDIDQLKNIFYYTMIQTSLFVPED